MTTPSSGLGVNWGQQRRNTEQTTKASSYHHPKHKQINNSHQIKELGSLILQTLDGFVFAMHKDGKIMYISETASVHLGLPQIDLTGSSVFDYVHPADREEIKKILNLSETERVQLDKTYLGIDGRPVAGDGNHELDGTIRTAELGRSFCMRMKCILPKRNAGLVSSGYKAIHCNGYLKVRCDLTATDEGTQVRHWDSYALVAVGHSLLPSASTEVKLSDYSFMFRASLDFKFYYVESNMTDLLGLEQFDLMGQSLYQFVHLNDIQHLEQSHRLLLDKGQVVSRYYRLMKRDGGFLWIQSYSTLVNNPRNMPKPQHIVSICLVLGDDRYDLSRSLHDRCDESIKQLDETTSWSNPQTSPSKIGSTSGQAKESAVAKRESKLCQIQKRTRSQRTGSVSKSQLAKAAGQLVFNGSLQNKRALLDKTSSTINDEAQSSATFENDYSCQLIGSHPSSDPRPSFERTDEFCATNKPLTDIGLSIGSIRRASEDSCSVVSSVASTSVSSRSSNRYSTESEIYLLGASGYPLVRDQNCLPQSNQHEEIEQTHIFHPGTASHSRIESMNQPQVEPPDNLIWSRTEEYSDTVPATDSCHQYQPIHNQFVQVSPTGQPWIINQVQVCSNSFNCGSDASLDNHMGSSEYYHHQPPGEVYIETNQPYSSTCTNYSSAMIQFNQVPQTTNLYSV